MPKLRDVKTIKKEIKKRKDIREREDEKLRSLNGELSAAVRREKAQRQQAIGAAIEELLGVGALSDDDQMVLIARLKITAHSKDGSVATTAERLANAIKEERAKVSATKDTFLNEDGSADQKPSAVPTERQDFAGGKTGSSLPLFPHQSPNPTSI